MFKKKKTKITSVGEHVDKLEPLRTADGKEKWYNSSMFPQKN